MNCWLNQLINPQPPPKTQTILYTFWRLLCEKSQENSFWNVYIKKSQSPTTMPSMVIEIKIILYIIFYSIIRHEHWHKLFNYTCTPSAWLNDWIIILINRDRGSEVCLEHKNTFKIVVNRKNVNEIFKLIVVLFKADFIVCLLIVSSYIYPAKLSSVIMIK